MVLEELDKNLVLFIPFSEGAPDVATVAKVLDRSQSQNHGTISGAILVKPYEDMSNQSDDEGDNPLVIIDDGGDAFWTLVAGVASDDAGTVKKGANSYKTALTADTLDMYHDYGANQDWTQYDYLTIWIYGCNTADTITLYVYNEVYAGRTNGYSYAITDDFTGWERFIIPLERFSDVAVPTGWDNVRCIRLVGGAPQTCDYFFDRFTLDVGNWRFGEAGDFDGTDDWIDIDGSATKIMAGLSSFSGAIWLNLPSFTNLDKIWNKPSGNDTGLQLIGVGGQLRFLCDFITGGITLDSVGVLTINTWHLVVCVLSFDGMKIYIDGILDVSNSNTGVIVLGAEDFLLMRNWSAGTAYVEGLIDEVRVYNRALSPEEIRTLFEQGTRR